MTMMKRQVAKKSSFHDKVAAMEFGHDAPVFTDEETASSYHWWYACNTPALVDRGREPVHHWPDHALDHPHTVCVLYLSAASGSHFSWRSGRMNPDTQAQLGSRTRTDPKANAESHTHTHNINYVSLSYLRNL